MKRKITMLATTAFLGTAGSAVAQETGYNAAAGAAGPGTPTSGGPGELPFTGADTTVLLMAGAAMLLVGTMLRRASRRAGA